MRRRRGSVLIASLIVMLVLTIFGGAIFTFAYANYQSAEQQRGVMMAQAAVGSLLYSVGVVVSDDLAKAPSDRKIPLSSGNTLSASVQDGPITAGIEISMKNDKIYFLKSSARYGEWQSGERALEIVKKNLASGGVTSEWIWR